MPVSPFRLTVLLLSGFCLAGCGADADDPGSEAGTVAAGSNPTPVSVEADASAVTDRRAETDAFWARVDAAYEGKSLPYREAFPVLKAFPDDFTPTRVDIVPGLFDVLRSDNTLYEPAQVHGTIRITAECRNLFQPSREPVMLAPVDGSDGLIFDRPAADPTESGALKVRRDRVVSFPLTADCLDGMGKSLTIRLHTDLTGRDATGERPFGAHSTSLNLQTLGPGHPRLTQFVARTDDAAQVHMWTGWQQRRLKLAEPTYLDMNLGIRFAE